MNYSRYVKWCVDHRKVYTSYSVWLDVMTWNGETIGELSS